VIPSWFALLAHFVVNGCMCEHAFVNELLRSSSGLALQAVTGVQAILIELVPDFGVGLAYFRNLVKQANRIYIPIHTSSTGSTSMVLRVTT
jgi:hypothetical protein